MRLTRRGFLKAAVIAPIAAAVAPLLGQAATREYVRFRAASFGSPVVAQIRFMANIMVREPRYSRILTHITE